MSKHFFKAALSVVIAVGLASTASAKLPKDVLDAYRSYETALVAQDLEQAEQSALTAWKAAEESLGDTKTTGDLAQNYADIAASNKSNYVKIKRAYERSIKLASYYPENEALLVRMDRTVSLAHVMRSREGRILSVTEIIKDAEAANAPATTLLAEIYTLRALSSLQGRKFYDFKRDGRRAVDLFAEAQDDLQSPYRDIASDMVSGYKKSIYVKLGGGFHPTLKGI